MTEAEYQVIINRQAAWKKAPSLPVKMPLEFQQAIAAAKGKPPKESRANKTELEYSRLLALEYPGHSITFNSLRLKCDNGHAYTPDWVVNLSDGLILLVEVKARGKNGFRHPSYQRAKVMYDQCRVEWPMFRYRWAEKQSGVWTITDY